MLRGSRGLAGRREQSYLLVTVRVRVRVRANLSLTP